MKSFPPLAPRRSTLPRYNSKFSFRLILSEEKLIL